MQAPIAKSTALARKHAHAFASLRIIRAAALISHRGPIHAQRIAGPALAHLEQGLKMSYRLPLMAGR